MTCRPALALCALLLVACGDGEDVDEMSNGIPPWFMWGNTQTVTVSHSLLTIDYATSQIVKVNYKRPESFNFFFAAKIIGLSDLTDSGEVDVYFDLTIGSGRTNIVIPGFEHFYFSWQGAPTDPPLGELKYSTQVVTPVRRDGTATTTSIVDEIVAQDINLQARISHTGGATPVKTATMELTSFFAPINHVRPEWFEGRFPGGEDNGT